MAKRFTDTEKFSDKWYRKLSLLHKVVWEYLLAECNHAGILENFDLEMMSFKIGAEVTQEDLKVFEGRIIFISDDVLFIPKFIEFQYGKLNPQSKVHASVLKELEKYSIDRVSIELGKGMDSIKDKDKEIDIDNTTNKQIDTINNNDKKIKSLDPYMNPIRTLFIQEYQKVFNNTPRLASFECQRLVELANANEDIEKLIPIAIQRLKKLDFRAINYTPCANWLLKENNFERIINGEFEPQKSDYERLMEKYGGNNG